MNEARSLTDRGIALAGEGRLAEALDAFDRAVAASSDLADADLGRSKVLAALGRADEAMTAFDQAVTLDPAVAHADRARVAMDAENLDVALSAYQEAAEADPGNPHRQLDLGAVLLSVQRWSDALDAFNQAVQLSPSLSVAYIGRSEALRELGHFEAAFGLARPCGRTRPREPAHPRSPCRAAGGLAPAGGGAGGGREGAGRRKLGGAGPLLARYALSELKRTSEARAAAETAAALDPRDADVLGMLTSILADQGHFDEALSMNERTIQLEPGSSSPLRRTRRVAVRRGPSG